MRLIPRHHVLDSIPKRSFCPKPQHCFRLFQCDHLFLETSGFGQVVFDFRIDIADHVSKPFCAEATARSTSSAPADWTVQMTSPVAGLTEQPARTRNPQQRKVIGKARFMIPFAVWSGDYGTAESPRQAPPNGARRGLWPLGGLRGRLDHQPAKYRPGPD